jgi:2-polyprenyl-3-methyl-5-hydroxy-6-metoxy-1,4-benzoquinol methylase
MQMTRLTRREHWDAVHAFERTEAEKPAAAEKGWVRRTMKRLLGDRLVEFMSSYDDHQIWDVHYRQHMPLPGAKVVEIGSAPGEHLVRLSETFGLVPYGIEYSEAGVEVNRSLFAARGLDQDNVIPLDFFSEECLERYREGFDVVVSRGFIEHFDEPKAVVDRHLDLLKPGGLLVVTIPNLRGVNYALTEVFHSELIPMHNLTIMAKAPFLQLFDIDRVRPLICAYVGTFSFYLFNVKEGSRLAPLLRVCMKAQTFLNVLFRAFLGDRGAENRFTSPQLIFMGVKR